MNPVKLLAAVAEALMAEEIDQAAHSGHDHDTPVLGWYLANSPGEQETPDGKSG